MQVNNEIYIGAVGADKEKYDEREVRFLQGYERIRIPLRNNFDQPIDTYVWAINGHLCIGIEGHIDNTSDNPQNAAIICVDVGDFLAGKMLVEDQSGIEHEKRGYFGDCILRVWADKDSEDTTHEVSLRFARELPSTIKGE